MPSHPAIAAVDGIVASPVGPLGIAIEGGAVARIACMPQGTRPRPPHHPLALETAHQLQRYFADPGWTFTLPLAEHGTPYQQRVWTTLRTIPRGETRSYGALAAMLGSAPRAIGGACRANPLLIVTPCHRVIATQAGLGGFAGATDGEPLQTKRWLLDHEVRKP